MQRRLNPRDAKRMMQRMGMNMSAVDDVEEVIIKTPNKEIVIAEPEVAIVQVQGQKIFQVAGGNVSERAPQPKISTSPTTSISEEDVQLVAGQTGKSPEAARKALIECEGDLAKAILLLQS